MTVTSSGLVKNATLLGVVAISVIGNVTTLIAVAWWRRQKKYGNGCGSSTIQREYEALLKEVKPHSILEFESAANGIDKDSCGSYMDPLAKIYFQYFSDPATTVGACRKFFGSIRLLPSILTGDVSKIDTQLKIFGATMEFPVLVAPTAFHVLACPEGEVATARGAGAAGAGYCYNWMLSSKVYTNVVKEPGVKWLHLYMFEEKDLVEASIRAAEKTGAFSAVIVTCDHPHTRVQRRMLKYFRKAQFPLAQSREDHFFPNQAAVGFEDITLGQLIDPNHPSGQNSKSGGPGGTNSTNLTWYDVQWIQSITTLPVVAKGILSADDALKAMEAGVDGIVVSNHGGRQCDIAVPAIEALPVVVRAVTDATPDGETRIPIFVDTGVRTSGDIVRALCLGATGVLLGRPPLWALACEGSTGLQRMMDTLRMDLQDDLRSLGVTSTSQLSMEHLWPPDRDRIEASVTACLQNS